MITHEERVARWGDPPDALHLDEYLCGMLEHYGCNPRTVAEEICWKRRNQGKYHFCSSRTLSREKIRHVVLESVPFEVPPMRLKVGRSRNADIVVERSMPGSDYRLEYESTGSRGTYFLRSGPLPQIVMVGLVGRPVSNAIEGLSDSRVVRYAMYSKKSGVPGIFLSVRASQRQIEVAPVDHRLMTEFHDRAMTFGDGCRMKLKGVLDHLPDKRGAKIYKRERMDFASLTLHRQGQKDDYIAIQPHASSARPKLEIEGADRTLPMDCYLVRADRAIPAQLSAIAVASDAVFVNDQAFIAKLKSRLPRE